MRYDTVKKKTKVLDKLTKSEKNGMSREPLEIIDGYIYYGKWNSEYSATENMYRIKLDGTGKEKLVNNIHHYKINEDRIYYCIVKYDEDYNSIYSYYSVDMSGGDKREETEFEEYKYEWNMKMTNNSYMKLSGPGWKYSGKYKKSNLIEDENKSHKKNKLNKPIILKDKFIDYNYKENYEFKRQEKHKFIKCWKCGRENIYYKVKCNNCRFTIHDEQIPKIKKTQLSQYDVIHNIPIINDDKKMNEPDEENKFKEIKIKYNSPIKENIKYKSLENNWKCKFCKKINKETIKYCQFCFKNRL